MVCRGVSPTTAHMYPLKSQVHDGELTRRHLATSSTAETLDKGLDSENLRSYSSINIELL